MTLLLIIVFTVLGSVMSVGLAAVVLLVPSERKGLIVGGLVPYAIGTLLGAAFFGMIPHSLSQLSSRAVLATLLLGVVLFYVLEKFAVWRHCHEVPCDTHTSAGAMILIGDALHNFVDGVAIAAAFGVSTSLGVTTAVAVIAHEVPQEVGDFAILLQSGYSQQRALLYNTLSSLAALLGAVLTYFLLPIVQDMVPYLLAISAASFVYIALADLVPGRRTSGGLQSLIWELPLIAVGVGTILVVKFLS